MRPDDVGGEDERIPEAGGREGDRDALTFGQWALGLDARARDVDVEVALPVGPARVTSSEQLQVGWLPAVAELACAVHAGPLQDIGDAYAALSAWAPANAYQVSGPIREVYLSGPEEGRVVWEVQFPVQIPGQSKKAWPTIRYERAKQNGYVRKRIRVTDSPLQIAIEPWTEGKTVVGSEQAAQAEIPNYLRYSWDPNLSQAEVNPQLLTP